MCALPNAPQVPLLPHTHSRHGIDLALQAEFGDHGELALDANRIGNEGRFINDFRNTGRRQNVEFQLRRASDGELRQGVFVCAKEGIRKGEELLISYGKPFWRARVGDLEAFITRLPGQ